ncbi:MAG TPA: hypothetical protein DCS13_05040 [Candidatus Margulisbacteria bacterium]|nr:MAG: hypothetical protein A2X43_00135 [Candidatus Margulisbacteria bacterium GWD2_39_127]HAR62811.1 hypothetical protein [Candidatus Margulisiibacteriota bacterium]
MTELPDNPIYQKNLEALKARNEKLAQEIAQLVIPEDYTYCLSDSGLPNCKIKVGNKDFYYHDQGDPQKEAEDFAALFSQRHSCELNSAVFGIIVGFGFGYHLLPLLDKITWLKELIIIEPDKTLFKLMLHYQDTTGVILHKNISFIVGELTLDKLRALRGAQWLNLGNRIMINWNTVTKYYLEDAGIISRVVQDFVVERSVIDKTAMVRGTMMIENRFKNIRHLFIEPNADGLFGKFRNLPFVCVAAGPSLNNYLPDLKRIREKAVFIVADTAFKVLIEYGIVPDIVTATDPPPTKYKYFEENPHLTKDILLVTSSNTYSGLLDCWQGPIRFVVAGDGLYDFVFEKLAFPDAATFNDINTVAMLTLMLADKLGADPVILVGQDLSLASTDHAGGSSVTNTIDIIERDGKTYSRTRKPGSSTADGSIETSAHQIVEKEVFYVPDYDSRPVPTWEDFRFFITSLGGYCSHMKAPVFNLTEKGARIDGAQRVSFSEIVHYFNNEVIFKEIFNSYCERTPKKLELATAHVNKCIESCQAFDKWIQYCREEIARRHLREKYDFLHNEIARSYSNSASFMRLLDMHIPAAIIRASKVNFQNYHNLSEEKRYRKKYINILRLFLSLERACSLLKGNLQSALGHHELVK